MSAAAAKVRARAAGRGTAVAAAGLAGMAEGAVWFFPVRFLDGLLGGTLTASPASLALFAAAFGAVAAAVALAGGGTGTAAVLLAVGVVAGLAEGLTLETAQPGGMLAGLLVVVGLVARAGFLGVRDWREPVQGGFGVSVVGLLVAAAGSGFAGPDGGALLALAVPAVFLGFLASRAMSVRLADGAAPGDGRRAAGGIAAAGALLGLAALAGGGGGPLQSLGRLVAPAAGAVLGFLLLLFSYLVWPILWLADRFQIGDLRGLREALDRLRGEVEQGARAAGDPEAGSALLAVQRILGLLFVALLAIGLLLLYRRLRDRRVAFEPGRRRDLVEVEALETEGSAAPAAAAGESRRRWGRPPEDTVRRWYAEALEGLARLGIVRPASATPAEFARVVDRTLPGAGSSFGPLTAAYERVRYGALAAGPDELRSLRAGRGRLRRTLREAIPPAGDDAHDPPAGDDA